MTDRIHLGFEVGTGEPVAIPLRHLAVTGQTNESGKTTTLEALVVRSGSTALAFVTKRGEGAFEQGHRVQPYFRDRADWQFVTSIIDATLQEKNKFLRPWIMRICRTTQTLADVHAAVRKALVKAKGIHEGVYTQLDAYLDLIVPEIRRFPLAARLELGVGLHVMDVSQRPTPMQMLFVQSALDWVNAEARDTIVVIPEAWEFVPEAKSSPVKASAIALVRKGAAVGNRIWLDSQDMAGVDKTLLRGCAVWLIGVQREANEIKRNLANIPHGVKKPTADQVALLKRGQFYACWAEHAIKTYVQPVWMSGPEAQAIAQGDRTAPAPPKRQESTVTEQEAQELREKNQQLQREVNDLRGELRDVLARLKKAESSNDKVPASAPVPEHHVTGPPLPGREDEDALYQRIRDRLAQEAPALLRVLVTKPEIEVEVTRQTVTADGSSWIGWTARLIADGFFDQPRKSGAVWKEATRRGATGVGARADEACKKLLAEGFLTKEEDGYVAVKGMKVNIVGGR
jgi:hypothetical protein